jgi:hypothetical protein
MIPFSRGLRLLGTRSQLDPFEDRRPRTDRDNRRLRREANEHKTQQPQSPSS